MIRLIYADLYRIFRKKSFKRMWIIFSLLSFFSIIGNATMHDSNAAAVLDAINSYTSKGFFLLFISIPIFMGVYADEISSHSMQCIIGRGLTRNKILWAKLSDCIILTTIVFVVYMGVQGVFLFKAYSFSHSQKLAYCAYVLICILKVVGASTFSMMLLFITNTLPIGVIGVIFFTTLSPNIVSLAYTLGVKPVYYSYDMLLLRAMNKLVAGAAAWELIPCVLIYVSGAWLITLIFCRRKEFDF